MHLIVYSKSKSVTLLHMANSLSLVLEWGVDIQYNVLVFNVY